VLPRLSALDADELEAVRLHEAAHRSRKTILSRVAQLQGS
jgi:Zn-dependent protease with chaperone function